MHALIALAGLALLVWSAERLLDSTLGIAAQLRLPPAAVGATALALGTSLPEFAVAVSAALDNRSAIAVGNALGSNIANVGLALGLTALVLPLTMPFASLRRALLLSLAAIVATCAALADLELSRNEGCALLLGLGLSTWLLLAAPGEAAVENAHRGRRDWLWFVIGLALLTVGAELLVRGASQLALGFGISELVVGATVVAIGTSLPEISASLSGALRGEHGLAIGNVLGSNIFNLFGVLGVAAVLSPWQAPDNAVLYRDAGVCLALTCALAALLWAQHQRGTEPLRIGRIPATLLLCCYAGYFVLLFNY